MSTYVIQCDNRNMTMEYYRVLPEPRLPEWQKRRNRSQEAKLKLIARMKGNVA